MMFCRLSSRFRSKALCIDPILGMGSPLLVRSSEYPYTLSSLTINHDSMHLSRIVRARLTVSPPSRNVLTGYVLDSSWYGWPIRLSSRFQQRDEGVPRRPGGPPYLGCCCSNYLSETHSQHVLFWKGPNAGGKPPFPLCSLSRTVLAVLNRTPEMRERGRPHWCSLEHFYLVPTRAIGR